MIRFQDLYFDDNGVLDHCKYINRELFHHSPLWRVVCEGAEYTIDLMDSFSYEKTDYYIELTWKSPAIEVVVTILCFGKYEFHIAVKGNEAPIEKIYFPVFHHVDSFGADEDAYMLFPYQNGWLIKNPIATVLDYEGNVPFWLGRGKHYYENEYPAAYSFQFFSYYNIKSGGCYFAAEDPEAYIKTFGIYNDGCSGLAFSLINYPENMGKAVEYVQPYHFVLLFFKGDWQTSAEIYRRWAIGQKWANKRLTERQINPDVWKTNLWRINHTDYKLGTRTEEYFDTCRILQDKVDSDIGLHWYGWNMGEHDVNYPEYIDRTVLEQGWGESLKKWVQKFHDNEFSVIPYVNARLWDKEGKSWEECFAEQSAIKDQGQGLLLEPWKGDSLKPMCPSSVLWNQKVSDFSHYVTKYNFSGLYVDQVGSYNATLCFDPSHPHPLGGGTWWRNDYAHMMRMLRKKSGGNKLFTTESCCEAYLDLFDMFLVLDTTVAPYFAFKCMDNYHAEPVPLFNMVYGDYGQLYGSNARFSDSLKAFEFNFIRNILWGFVPTVEGGDRETMLSPSAKPYFDIIKKGVDFYKKNKNLLFFGRLKRVFDHAGKEYHLEFDHLSLPYRSIIHTLWEDGNGKEYTLIYNLDDAEYEIEEGIMVEGHSFCIFES